MTTHIKSATLKARIEETAADWWDKLDKKQQKQYVDSHPNSKYAKNAKSAKAPAAKSAAKPKAASAKKELRTVPKLSDLWMEGDDFTDAQNERARKAALKEIQDIKDQNEEINKQNKEGAPARRAATKEGQVAIGKTGPLSKQATSLKKKLGTRAEDICKKTMDAVGGGTSEAFKAKVAKSPGNIDYVLKRIGAHLGSMNSKTMPLEERKDFMRSIHNLNAHGTREQKMEFINSFF